MQWVLLDVLKEVELLLGSKSTNSTGEGTTRKLWKEYLSSVSSCERAKAWEEKFADRVRLTISDNITQPDQWPIPGLSNEELEATYGFPASSSLAHTQALFDSFMKSNLQPSKDDKISPSGQGTACGAQAYSKPSLFYGKSPRKEPFGGLSEDEEFNDRLRIFGEIGEETPFSMKPYNSLRRHSVALVEGQPSPWKYEPDQPRRRSMGQFESKPSNFSEFTFLPFLPNTPVTDASASRTGVQQKQKEETNFFEPSFTSGPNSRRGSTSSKEEDEFQHIASIWKY